MTKSSVPFSKLESAIAGLENEKLQVLYLMLLAPHFAPVFGAAKLMPTQRQEITKAFSARVKGSAVQVSL